ncbi:hypothetical protein VN1338_30840 [Helicobacter pylori]
MPGQGQPDHRHPARGHRLTDVGRLEPGARADLVVLDDDLAVTRVVRAGSWITSPDVALP